MRVAVVGAGPRGLWAAESLMERARQRGASIQLTVFSDVPLSEASAPGAFGGSVPQEWVLNAPKSIVRTQLGELDLDDRYPGDFPSRRVVGAHLEASWRALEENLPPRCSFEFRLARVATVVPDADVVVVDGESFDEVLIATGHAHDWPGSLAHTDFGDLRAVSYTHLTLPTTPYV